MCKVCSKCGIEKPFDAFGNHKRTKDGLYTRCRECKKIDDKLYVEMNKDEVAQKNKRYRARNQQKRRAYDLKWRADNKDIVKKTRDKWKEANKERVAAVARKWAYENSLKCRTNSANKRARKLRASPYWANKEKIEEFYFTANMLGMHTGEWYHVDHIVPLQNSRVCGLHVETNMRVITAKENLTKGNTFVM